MTKDKSIAIANIYYMLSYVYQNLQQSNFEKIKTEAFENVQDLFAAILATGMMAQLKQGLNRIYIEEQDTLSTLRGKINLKESLQLKMKDDLRLSCTYDELSENHYMNQIIKTAALCLIYDPGVQRKNKDSLKRVALFLSDIDTLEPSTINWRNIHYHRNNASYRLLMNICYLVLHELLLTTTEGEKKLATFLHGQEMSGLYEKFILAYYKKHFPQYKPASRQIKWDTEGPTELLPKMETDIILTDDNSHKKLIIDAKYYGNIMQSYYDTEKFQSGHLYQIFAYVKNEDSGRTGLVDGLLLYAKTEDIDSLNQDYSLSGNRIGVRTLDLNVSFPTIRKQLDRVVEDWLN